MNSKTVIDKITSEHFYNLVVDIFKSNEDFSIILNNNNDWDYELPQRLQKEKKFLLEVVDMTKEDSYITDKNRLVINTEFDDNKYSKELINEDIFGIVVDAKQYLTKTYEEEHPRLNITHKSTSTENIELQEKSTRAFKRNNPDLINV